MQRGSIQSSGYRKELSLLLIYEELVTERIFSIVSHTRKFFSEREKINDEFQISDDNKNGTNSTNRVRFHSLRLPSLLYAGLRHLHEAGDTLLVEEGNGLFHHTVLNLPDVHDHHAGPGPAPHH